MAKGVRVPSREAEKAKRELIRSGVLETGKKVKREGGFVIFPVKEVPEGLPGCEVEFEEKGRKGFKDYLKEFLPPDTGITSFDVIGDIAIIEVPRELEEYEKRIAESLARAHKNVKTVLKKAGGIKGKERIRDLRHLFGEEKTETLYREHGLQLKLDVSRVYFSPRLSYERQRILEQVEDGEVIVDLFAGVGPFSILLAKYRDVKVYAIEINPVAYEYLKENIRINKVGDKVVPLLGDCRKLAPKGAASRVIMNLPKTSHEFLDLAFDVIKKGVIHFYSISPEQDLYGSKIDFIKKTGKKKGRKAKILNRRVVRPYSPYRYHVVIDAGVE
jgi:tRNA (guanine37-N1)-methyltransferase